MLNNILDVTLINRYNNVNQNMAMHCCRTAILSSLLAEKYSIINNKSINFNTLLLDNIFRGLIKTFKGDLSIDIQKQLNKKNINTKELNKIAKNKLIELNNQLEPIINETYDNKHHNELLIVEIASIIDDYISSTKPSFFELTITQQEELIMKRLNLSTIDVINTCILVIDLLKILKSNPNIIKFYKKYSQLANIKRWNGIQTINVAENDLDHSFKVAALLINFNLHFDIVDNKNIGELILKALLHDFSEVELGDIPTPIKYANENFKNSLHSIEENFNKKTVKQLNLNLPFFENCLINNKKDDNNYIDFYDKLDAYFYIINQYNLGNKYFQHMILKMFKQLMNFENQINTNIFKTTLTEFEQFKL